MDSAGRQADGDSGPAAVSSDGRILAFSSAAANLVADDQNGHSDLFVHDLASGQTLRVSRGVGQTEANGHSILGGLSWDGRTLVFESDASNLVPGDTNRLPDIFITDWQEGTTVRVSVNSQGEQANGASRAPRISADGTRVVFASDASNLVPGDTNGSSDVFLHDRRTGRTRRISVDPNGHQVYGPSSGPVINGGGNLVLFHSRATQLVPADPASGRLFELYLADLESGGISRISRSLQGTAADGHSYAGDISADGRYLTFSSEATNLVAGDSNGSSDIFLHDRLSATTRRISLSVDGSQANGPSAFPRLSLDGRSVVFHSTATNLTADAASGAGDIFYYRRSPQSLSRVSRGLEGPSDGWSTHPSLSADGQTVAFASLAANLVADDTNQAVDIFVARRADHPPPTQRTLYLPAVSRHPAAQQPPPTGPTAVGTDRP